MVVWPSLCWKDNSCFVTISVSIQWSTTKCTWLLKLREKSGVDTDTGVAYIRSFFLITFILWLPVWERLCKVIGLKNTKGEGTWRGFSVLRWYQLSYGIWAKLKSHSELFCKDLHLCLCSDSGLLSSRYVNKMTMGCHFHIVYSFVSRNWLGTPW